MATRTTKREPLLLSIMLIIAGAYLVFHNEQPRRGHRVRGGALALGIGSCRQSSKVSETTQGSLNVGLTVNLVQRSLEEHAGHVRGDGGRGRHHHRLPVGRHEALDAKLLHHLLLQELHLGRLSVHQHHVPGGGLEGEGSRGRSKVKGWRSKGSWVG